MRPRDLLRGLLDAALQAADAGRVSPPFLPKPPRGRTLVVGAGKAAAAMARAVETRWHAPLSGVVVTRYGHGLPLKRIEVVEASHPVPDEASQKAASRILESVRNLTPDDLVLCLMSGGASALLALPAGGVSLDDKRAVTRALLKCGATIAEINCVRKHLSAIKGGRLAAAAYPARVETLAISDVPGDDPAVIGSGPTVPDPSTFAEARAILAKYAIKPPPAVASRLAQSCDETPKPGDPRLAHTRYHLIATPQMSLEAAAKFASRRGVTPVILGDGIEGSENNAGAIYGPDSLARAAKLGLDLKAKLAENDAWGAFDALHDLIVTGPTRTNVNDFRAILVLKPMGTGSKKDATPKKRQDRRPPRAGQRHAR